MKSERGDKKMSAPKLRPGERMARTILAPRIEVVLVPVEGKGEDGPYELWLLIHVPDGKPPTTVRLAGGPYDGEQSIKAILAVYTSIGEHFAFPGADLYPDRGAMQSQ
jgi:hypothetical protein